MSAGIFTAVSLQLLVKKEAIFEKTGTSNKQGSILDIQVKVNSRKYIGFDKAEAPGQRNRQRFLVREIKDKENRMKSLILAQDER